MPASVRETEYMAACGERRDIELTRSGSEMASMAHGCLKASMAACGERRDIERTRSGSEMAGMALGKD